MALEAEDIWSAPGFLIRRCNQIATSIFLDEAREFDFSPILYSALAFVQLEPGIDQRSLGERIALDRSSVTKCVDRLVERGLISRSISSNDKRARSLQITQQGTTVLSSVYEAAGRTKERIEQRFGSDRLALLQQLLLELGEALQGDSRVSFGTQDSSRSTPSSA